MAVFLGPLVTRGRDLSQGGEVMVWLMIMAIGWSVSAWPAKKITGALQKAVKKAKKPVKKAVKKAAPKKAAKKPAAKKVKK